MKKVKSHEHKLLVYGRYSQAIEGIKYLQVEQTAIRFETSKILLGTFTIIGALFLISSHFLHFQPLLVGVFVPFLSIILIQTRLIEDLVVKEGVRVASFAKALHLEEKYDWLPKYHTNMFYSNKKEHHGSGHRKSSYYLGCVGILLILSALSLGLMPNFSKLWMRIGIALLYLVLFLVYYKFLNKMVGRTSKMIESLR